MTKSDFIALVSIVAIWQISATILQTNLFPSFLTCLSLIDSTLARDWIWHCLHSLMRIFVGIATGMILGMAFGFLLGRHPKIDRLLMPGFFFTYSFPKAVLAPLLVILCGIGEESKVLLLSIVAFFQIGLSTRDAVRNIDSRYIFAFKSLDRGTFSLYRYVLFPAILPQVFSALRISLGSALGLLFFIEGYGSQWGLGYFIWDAFQRFDYPLVYLGCFLFCLVGWLLFRLLDTVEKNSTPWTRNGSILCCIIPVAYIFFSSPNFGSALAFMA